MSIEDHAKHCFKNKCTLDISLNSLLITFSFFYSSISDVWYADQCKRFVKQGGVERLNGFLSEDSLKRHCELASQIMENVHVWQTRFGYIQKRPK